MKIKKKAKHHSEKGNVIQKPNIHKLRQTKKALKKKNNKIKAKKILKRIIGIILLIVLTPIAIVTNIIVKIAKLLKPSIKFILKSIKQNLKEIVEIIVIAIAIIAISVYTNKVDNRLNNEDENINKILTEIQEIKDNQENLEVKQVELEEKEKQLEISKVEKKVEEERLAKEAKEKEKARQEQIRLAQVTSRGEVTSRSESLVTSSKVDYQAYAKDLCINTYGWSEYDYQCLVKLWERESNWNPNAHNKSSGAHGIPQSLPASKMASEGDDYYTNGKTQIRWGLKYIKQRYGTPAKAWAHSESHNWY